MKPCTPTPSRAHQPGPRLASRAAALRSSEIRDLLRVAEAPGVLSLAGGLPAADALPHERIAVALERCLTTAGVYGPLALQYGPTEGLAVLRELLAVGTTASAPLGSADNAIITTGSQQGLDLVTRVLIDPGDTVVVEDPGYLGARQVFVAHGAQLVGVPVDQDGIDTEQLEHRLSRGLRPQIVSVVPNFSNPSGVVLSAERRVHLAALARRFDFAIVSDDPYRALAFDPVELGPLARLAPDHTVSLGSASKVIAPGLRVGWLSAPPCIRGAIVRAKQTVDLHTATLPQLVVADLLADGAFMTAHLCSVRAAYHRRATTLHTAVAGVIDAAMPTGGMFLWGHAPMDTREALTRAIAVGVAYVPGDAFTIARDGSRAVRLSFATLDEAALGTAAARLCTVLAGRPNS